MKCLSIVAGRQKRYRYGMNKPGIIFDTVVWFPIGFYFLFNCFRTVTRSAYSGLETRIHARRVYVE